MLTIGTKYHGGVGITQNHEEALKWYRKSAELGQEEAMLFLARMYENGEGTAQNYPEAAKWYRKAADLGYVQAMNNLGVQYGKGNVVVQDYVQAHMWYNIAAARGDEIARLNRDNLAKWMTPAQIAQAQKLAAEWKPKGQ
jgi:TPR repeat protein